ncbi:BatD family protein [Synoicihabitans lomoniglobus]|uniref:BatD family protein n=1 Tax=Synoicihabitans lomoniglobus TaxID=2909285 RepID=A0AAE9ZUG3_9BACT|nr:BatD family protein [Opitutaceae bacterium LMO-M01]WED62995.1 BatD family protein [Opitutaceae bacterium LMO-M01]
MRCLRFIPLLLVIALPAWAQSVRWQPAGGFLARGQVTDLVLIFDNCEPSGEINLPDVPNLIFGPPQRGTQSSMNIVNGRTQSTSIVYFAYPSRPRNDDPVNIPSFTVATNVGPLSVAPVSFQVREATVGDSSIPVSFAANSKLAIGQGQLWAGEVVPIDYTLSVSARFRANLGSEPEWDPTPLIVEEWAEPTRGNEGTNADARALLTYSSRGYIRQPGTYAIPTVQQMVNIGVPSAGFLQSMRAEQYAITSDPVQLVVRPLPTPAPADFTGAVGDFRLVSKVVPEQARIGEPVTWTLSLEGTGNWPEISSLPAREASNSFRVVQPQATRTTAEGKLFDGSITEDVVLIPTQTGTFKLGPVSWTYFNPRTGKYRTLTAPETELLVDGTLIPPPPNQTAAASGNSPPPDVANGPSSGPALGNPTRPEPAPASPAALPGDPLPGSAAAMRPLRRPQVVATAITLAVLIPLLWLTLSSLRALRLDPGRSARAARQRLKSRIDAVGRTSAKPDREIALIAWQRDTALLWESRHAAPAPDLFADDAAWTQLWHEADRALYGEDGQLPPDWTTRAYEALARKRAPRFPVLSALAPRHLFPAIAVLIALSFSPDAGATSAVESYAAGDFAAAETAWRENLSTQPTDWIAHHNLALALAQQGRWGEAGAHAAVAFVQNPRDPSVRWHLTYTLERSGFTPPIIGEFAHPGWPEKIAREASPAQWQLVLLGGLLAGCIAIALVLGRAYGMRMGGSKSLAWLAGIIGVFAMVTAAYSLQTYGLTANQQAVLTWRSTELRSIPTDLNSEQETTTLAAGSLSRVQKSFLGWRQLAFPNGQTGWVRQEELVPLWRAAE